MRIPFLSSSDSKDPLDLEESEESGIWDGVCKKCSQFKDWVIGADLSSKNIQPVDALKAGDTAIRVGKVASEILQDTESVSASTGLISALGQAATTVKATLSLSELRDAVGRMRATDEAKEVVDSLFTAVLQMSRIAGGLSSLAALTEEVEFAAESIGRLSGPLLLISGALALVAPIQLGLRWWDAKSCLKTIKEGLDGLEDARWDGMSEAQVLFAALQKICEEDPLYLERAFKLTAEEQAELALITRRLVEGSPGACEEAENLLRDLVVRLKKSARGQQVDLLIAGLSLASFGFALLTPMGTTAQVIGGLAAVAALGKVGYDRWTAEPLSAQKSHEMLNFAAKSA
jgi:hypothetical protein